MSIFSDFFDNVADSRVLKGALEEMIERSNAVLLALHEQQQYQQHSPDGVAQGQGPSALMIEEIVERRLQEERHARLETMQRMEAKILELEARLQMQPPATMTSVERRSPRVQSGGLPPVPAAPAWPDSPLPPTSTASGSPLQANRTPVPAQLSSAPSASAAAPVAPPLRGLPGFLRGFRATTQGQAASQLDQRGAK